jgi:hypothetical protein
MRMSKSVSLVLVGSSLVLAGCFARNPPAQAADKDKDEETDKEKRTSGTGHSGHYHGGSFWGWGSSGSRSRPGTSGNAGAPRSGGFGSSGHAAAS